MKMGEYCEEEEEKPVKLFTYKKPMELFESLDMVKICAPVKFQYFL